MSDYKRSPLSKIPLIGGGQKVSHITMGIGFVFEISVTFHLFTICVQDAGDSFADESWNDLSAEKAQFSTSKRPCHKGRPCH